MMSGGAGRGMMGGSAARNRIAMAGGVPAPYTNLTNPLPKTAATEKQGAKVYVDNCASCHGAAGYGDGPAASSLNPRPADLAWLSRMPMIRWDAFMFWTVSEGGAPVGSAMPSFKNSLSEADRWAVIGYVQAHLPQATAAR
jgi:mono/diheme cytochrome c family protein